MTLILDAGPLRILADATDPDQPEVERILRDEPGRIVLPAFCAAEADYFIERDFGSAAESAFLRDLATGLFDVQTLVPEEYQLAVEVDEENPGLGLADISIVLLAARYDTRRVLTFDERDFRRVVPLQGGSFTVLPADEPSAPA